MNMNKSTIEGTVVKVTEQHIVVLCDDGTFKNIPRSTSDIPMMGEKVRHAVTKMSHLPLNWKKYTAAASVIILLFITFSLFQLQNSQNAYIIAIDINPSIELHTDNNLRVTNIKALNEDGNRIIGLVDAANQPVLTIIAQIIDQSVSQGYLTTVESGLITTSLISNESSQEKKIMSSLRAAMEQHLSKHGIEADISIAQENLETFAASQKLNLSVNQYVIYNRMQQQGHTVIADEIRGKSVAAILEMESISGNDEQKQIDVTRPVLNQIEQNDTRPLVDITKPEKPEVPSQPKPRSTKPTKPTNDIKPEINEEQTKVPQPKPPKQSESKLEDHAEKNEDAANPEADTEQTKPKDADDLNSLDHSEAPETGERKDSRKEVDPNESVQEAGSEDESPPLPPDQNPQTQSREEQERNLP
jgi:hypothetical protein